MDIRIILIVVLITIVAIRFYRRHFGKPEGKEKSRDGSPGNDDYKPYSGS